MKRFYYIILIFVIFNMYVYSENVNLNNIIQIDIPDDFERLSQGQALLINEETKQVWWSIYYEMVYENAHIPITINFFGQGIYDEIVKELQYDEERKNYYNNYNNGSLYDLLTDNYRDRHEINNNGLKYARLITYWPSGRSSDYLGFYFKVEDEYFDEVIINIYNSWNALGAKTELKIPEENLDNIIISENDIVIEYYEIITKMIDSIKINNFNKEITKYEHYVNFAISRDGWYLPKNQEINIYKKPDGKSEILKIWKDMPHFIRGIGDNYIYDESDYNWVRIKPMYGNYIGWVMEKDIRIATEDEMYYWWDD